MESLITPCIASAIISFILMTFTSNIGLTLIAATAAGYAAYVVQERIKTIQSLD